jgi:hypothetical protein
MIARGFILLGFRPSGMRTGHGSLEEGGHTSSLREVRMRKITGERKHTISSSTSYSRTLVHYLEKGERISTLIFCTVVMIEIVAFSKRKAVVPSRPRSHRLLSFLPSHSSSVQVNSLSLIPTVFHATGRSCRLSPTLKTLSLFSVVITWKSPYCHHVWRPLLEARSCSRS